MQKRTEFVIDRKGNVVTTGATVRVTQYPGGALATIYSDNGVTQAPNPISVDGNGRYEYYAANGHYTEIITTNEGAQPAINDISFDDSAPLEGSITWDPASLADGAGETSSAIAVAGAALGDFVQVSAPYDLQGVLAVGYVSAADNVKIRLQNESGGVVDLGSGTWRVRVRKQQ